MNYVIIMYISILCMGINSGKNGAYYTEKDFNVIKLLAVFTKMIIFVENGADISLLKRCQDLLGTDYYYAVINSIVLQKILENDTIQVHFFQKRTVIITKEQLNLTELLDRVLFPHYLTWVIFGGNSIRETPYIPPSCNVLFVNSTSKPISVGQMYHPKRGHEAVESLLSLEIPNFTGKLSLVKEKTYSLLTRKINFRNLSLNLQILHGRKECQTEEGEIMKKLSCIHQVLMMLVGIRLNYSVNFVECQEKEYPYTYPNGSDSKLYIELKNREVDFSTAVTHVTYRNYRRPYIDYVWPTFVLNTMMYLRQTRTAGQWATYLKPLEPSVWWSILTCITVTGVLVKIFEKLLANTLKFDLPFVYEVVTSTLRSLQVFCNQAITDLPTSYSIRMIYILKFFVFSVFFQAYCGYLVSFLAVVTPRFPFTDLNGFLENQKYRVMTLKKGFHRYYFKKIILEGHDENLMLPDEDLPQTVQKALDKLCTEDYLALSGFREDFLNFGSVSCKISELPSPLSQSYFGIGVHKKMPLKEYLKRELLHLHATGIIRRIGSRLSTHTDFHDSSSSEEYSRVSVMHVYSIFILLYAGIGLSLIILCLEIYVKKSSKNRLLMGQENSGLTPKESFKIRNDI